MMLVTISLVFGQCNDALVNQAFAAIEQPEVAERPSTRTSVATPPVRQHEKERLWRKSCIGHVKNWLDKGSVGGAPPRSCCSLQVFVWATVPLSQVMLVARKPPWG